MSQVKLFTRKVCPNCKTMQAVLNHMLKGDYETFDIEENQEAHDHVTFAGYRSVPVVQVGEQLYGFKDIREMELAIEALKAA